jgi:hypothetical protein
VNVNTRAPKTALRRRLTTSLFVVKKKCADG